MQIIEVVSYVGYAVYARHSYAPIWRRISVLPAAVSSNINMSGNEKMLPDLPGCVPDGVEHVDIAEQEQWQEQYAIRIPVLYDPVAQ